MASWTTPPTHVVGDALAVTDWNTIANNETFLYQKPYGLYYASTQTTAASNATVQVALAGTSAVNYGFSISSNNVVVPLTGVYQVSFCVGVATGGAGSGLSRVSSSLYKNGTAFTSGATVLSYTAGTCICNGSAILTCNANDTLGLYFFNGTSSSYPCVASSLSTYLQVAFIGSI